MTKHWWQKAVVYQIYPRSFQDSNGDGIGDIPGIIHRLDYLQRLGVDALWLCPIYASPNDDNGYDISNYEAIMPEFGTMQDVQILIQEAKKRGMKVLMDLVVNHTSDEHAWFIESRKSRNNPYRDFYIWRDPAADGGAPNSLTSTFGGSAWQLDQQTGQYYLHLFSKKQPDLNWQNPKLRDAIYKMMNFWIDQGIGGFRMDVIELLGKEPDKLITGNGPKLHTYIEEMNRNTFGSKDMLTVGECWGATPQIAQQYSDPKNHELSMIFQFEHIELDQQPGKEKWDTQPMSMAKLKQTLVKWQLAMQDSGWNTLFWSNHDIPRIDRWADQGQYHTQSLKMFAILLHLLKGTPYIFQGEELGMTNYPIKDISEADDIESKNMYAERLAKGYQPAAILAAINEKGRDNARTPMQWDDSENGGFTTGKPWLHVNPNYATINAEAEVDDSNSIFATYKRLIQLRKENPVVVYGKFELVQDTDPTLMAYYRIYEGNKWLVVANLDAKEKHLDSAIHDSSLLISNYSDSPDLKHIRPYEAFALKLQGDQDGK